MKFKYFLPLFIFFLTTSCGETSSKSEKKENTIQSTGTQKRISEKEEKNEKPIETLNTQSVIPFLFDYEKENKERYVRIITDYGNIDIELFNETPYHRANFIFLTKQNYFDGSVFHRIVKDFIIQGGNSDGWDIRKKRQKIGYYLLPPDTKKGFKHHRGIVSMPSSDIDNPHQFASPYEFFIVVQSPGAYHLDGNYTAFGKVIAGMEVVDKINQVETDEKSEWPKRDVKMKVVLLDR
ncbi:peptidylprolyl isomerase [Capnocytophaga cynodegmi]|uniref:Peptidyl-prolyl cis-trans isomerase n=1 Tax=Capnocytophaga cynodegmi TaxID=28189 RepID=A0A0B7HH88_9FLAO|nr:peptidylprolyl isomerase [Capnocytophaga cynodegmi]CEN36918.1 Peptidyl-prolyl cis-trans isomerase [Capnocytophaga cynodegmi]CEN40297.1 Peptidyl-prolyl cis-trans isomerase [Capnocytophaga cynodegmi]